MTLVGKPRLMTKLLAVICFLVLAIAIGAARADGPPKVACSLSDVFNCSNGTCERSGSGDDTLPIFFVLNFGNVEAPFGGTAGEDVVGTDASYRYREDEKTVEPEEGMIGWSLTIDSGPGRFTVLSGHCKAP